MAKKSIKTAKVSKKATKNISKGTQKKAIKATKPQKCTKKSSKNAGIMSKFGKIIEKYNFEDIRCSNFHIEDCTISKNYSTKTIKLNFSVLYPIKGAELRKDFETRWTPDNINTLDATIKGLKKEMRTQKNFTKKMTPKEFRASRLSHKGWILEYVA